jgi:hypothetical protein
VLTGGGGAVAGAERRPVEERWPGRRGSAQRERWPAGGGAARRLGGRAVAGGGAARERWQSGGR